MLILVLGIVEKCTLSGSMPFVYGNAKYCVLFGGFKGQNEAMAECRTLNAQLPLPKSKNEAVEFGKTIGNIVHVTALSGLVNTMGATLGVTGFTGKTWIGIRDLTQSGDKSKWKDAEGNLIGSRFVNLRVINNNSLQ